MIRRVVKENQIIQCNNTFYKVLRFNDLDKIVYCLNIQTKKEEILQYKQLFGQ